MGKTVICRFEDVPGSDNKHTKNLPSGDTLGKAAPDAINWIGSPPSTGTFQIELSSLEYKTQRPSGVTSGKDTLPSLVSLRRSLPSAFMRQMSLPPSLFDRKMM